ncbi:MAG: extracellular solute-binding protein [Acetatifactor sp.]|nr:extracellular solute-binding protein [Acetatifactor sp.]
MKKKTQLRLVLNLILILLLSACGGKGSASQNSHSQPENDTQSSWQDKHISLKHHFYDVYVADDIIYGYLITDDGITVVSQNAESEEVLREVAISNVYDVGNLTADAQGNIYLSGENTFWKIDGSGNITTFDNFTLEDVDWTRQVLPKGIYVDSEGYFYLHYEIMLPANLFNDEEEDDVYVPTDRIYVTDNQLNILFYEQVINAYGSQLLSFSFSENGTPTILVRTPDGFYISEIDVAGRKSVIKKEIDKIEISDSRSFAFTEKGFAFYSGNDLYFYDYAEQTQTRLLNLLSCGILADNIRYLGMKDGTIEIVDNYSETASSEYVTILEGENTKTTITLGVIMSNPELEQIVAGYNRFSDAGKVEIISYHTDDYSVGLDRLKLDIISGKAPDVMEVSEIDTNIFTAKGVFADLYTFMESDTDLQKDMLMDAVRTAYESDGHLYSMGAAFQIYSMWGAKGVFQENYGISMQRLIQLIENKGKTISAIWGFSADETVLTSLTTFSLNEFIDWDKAECDFTNEYMKGLLDFAAQYTGSYRGTLAKGISEGEILLTIGYIRSVVDYQVEKELYGGELAFVGLPTSKGTGTALSLRGQELAISAKGEHQELAWDFVKYYIQNGYTDLGFPTLKAQFDDAMQESMREHFVDSVDSVDGHERVPREVFWDGDGEMISIYAASQADVDAVIQLIERAETQYGYNPPIQNIINEEAQSYFSGQKDFQTVAEIIQNRVGIYLSEQMGN